MLTKLTQYKYISYASNVLFFEASFASPQAIIDEGSFYRLNELSLVDKINLVSVELDENIVRTKYKNGNLIELGIS